MAETIEDAKADPDGKRRKWVRRMVKVLKIRVADSGRRGKSPKGQPDGKSGGFGAPPQKQKPQPIVYTRTGQVDSTEQAKRKDQLPISAATTAADVTKIVESKKGHAGLTESQLDGFSNIARDAARFNTGVPQVPSAQETKQIREGYAKLNAALSSGNVEEAARVSRDLGLPISEQEIVKQPPALSEKQWKTLLALGVASVSITKTGSAATGFSYNWTDPNVPHVPNKELNALNGNAGYAQLVDDMAANGVTPLSMPPTQEQMHSYMENLRAKAARQAQIDFPNDPAAQQKACADALLAASQRLMDGMQVHYRGASGNDPLHGRNTNWSTFLFRKGQLVMGNDGKPLRLDLPSTMKEKDRKAEIAKWVKENGGGDYFTSETQTPEGWGDVTKAGVYGNRHESDCEGMAAFRLRTLPPSFKAVGAVSGRLRGSKGIGHLVAVFKSPEGRVYISSNGKPLIEVQPSGKQVTSSEIRAAVVQEFDDIYRGSQSEGDFFFGIGAPSAAPPSGTPLEAANKTADQVLLDASNDDILHTHNDSKMPPVDWNKLAP
jgi:hypothetical protein